ncbi:amidohydrolase [Anaerococcus tetradius]|uniref:amidohydrolase n=1 Tax=Anaerococcus tetradius TaxID=33036 RepID=UPI0023F4E5A9|nr:amidohydrolase [Anaerococcus tetradius]
MEDKLIIEQINNQKSKIIEERRHLHKLAEVSAKEFKTSAYLKEEVRKLGLPIVEVEGTGFFAILDTGKAGKSLGLRTDIDALPICESKNNLKNPRLVLSDDPNVFHACGHDGHMATLLASMRILVKNKDKLKGKIYFIFEEGEESGSGIFPMIDGLKNENIDAFYGNHLASFLKTGEISFHPGPIMAGFIMVDFTVKGVGGHSSRPDKAISPIFAQAAIIQSLASAWVNRLDPTKTVTLGLSTIHGGSAHNVIASEVRVDGTLRYFDWDEVERAIEQIQIVGENVARAHACEFINRTASEIFSPVINDEKLALLMKEAVVPYFGENIKEDTTWFASESFEAYGKLAPSLFALVGSANEEKGTGAQHHTPEFDIDEDSINHAIFAMVKFATSFLEA